MKKCIVLTMTVLMGLFFAASGEAAAQNEDEWSQSTACPGWNNPATFTTGGNKWSGSGIYVSSGKGCPNPLNGTEGVDFVGPNYTASQLSSVVSGASGYACSSIPNQNNQYLIMSDLNGRDPNTGNNLRYVPTQFNTHDTTQGAINTDLKRSIRIGDGCYWGSANTSNGGSGAVLNYTMRVTDANAMLYLYYAIVAESPTHGQKGNPTFIIRIMKRNAAHNWVQISDTLAYYINATPSSQSSASYNCPNMSFMTVAPAGQTGWHQCTAGYYKDWEKVCLNLTNYLYDTLQVQVIIYDCLYNAHYAYGYIAGECRPMTITTSGCPAGLSTDVTTLSAPQNMRNYVWYASEYGQFDPCMGFDPGQENSYATWRQLSESQSTSHTYRVQSNDFRVTRRRQADGSSITVNEISNKQTFRCKMTSAIDPAKPFDSYLYVNVQNTKPTMAVDSLFKCDGSAKLWNRSYVPGEINGVMNDSTRWSFYNNPSCSGTPELVLTGDSAYTVFDNNNLKGVLVRSYAVPNPLKPEVCYSEAIYPIKPRQTPRVNGMLISGPNPNDPRVLCDTASASITDTSSGTYVWREWSFRDRNAAESDMSLSYKVRGVNETNRTVRRSFTHSLEPIELLVRNGTYYFDPTHLQDTMWCETLVRDTIVVFLHPELEVLGDTVVCEGSRTNATVRALGVDGCTYEWSRTLGQITGGLPAGPTLQVEPYADTATYFVKVTSPQLCEAWDSIHVYLVRPKLTMDPADGRICPGEVATLTGSEAHHYSWTASPSDASMAGQENNEFIRVSPTSTTVYTLVGHGSNNCDASPLKKTVTVVPLPVSKVQLTPGFIDTDNPTVVLRDQSTYGVSSMWLFNDGQTATGREVSHKFNDCIGFDSVPVTLTSYNALDCPKVYKFNIPVNIFTIWFPTAFTPGSNDGNGVFSVYTINEYQFFHIYIYNRRGELVYDSDDVHFQWDGTHNGDPCPQGAYVYTCRYRKPGTTTLSSMQGTVTLIR